jgi:hypothetical protein
VGRRWHCVFLGLLSVHDTQSGNRDIKMVERTNASDRVSGRFTSSSAFATYYG